MKKIIQRAQYQTPPFFQKVQRIGLGIAAIGGAILAAPVVLPTMIITAAGYLTTAGTVAALISKLAVTDEKLSM